MYWRQYWDQISPLRGRWIWWTPSAPQDQSGKHELIHLPSGMGRLAVVSSEVVTKPFGKYSSYTVSFVSQEDTLGVTDCPSVDNVKTWGGQAIYLRYITRRSWSGFKSHVCLTQMRISSKSKTFKSNFSIISHFLCEHKILTGSILTIFSWYSVLNFKRTINTQCKWIHKCTRCLFCSFRWLGWDAVWAWAQRAG